MVVGCLSAAMASNRLHVPGNTGSLDQTGVLTYEPVRVDISGIEWR